MIQIHANNFFNLSRSGRMPGSGKDNQEMAAMKEQAEGMASMGDSGANGLGSGLDGGAN